MKRGYLKKESVTKLWKLIQKSDDCLKGRLLKNSNYPKCRNAYTHITLCVKNRFVIRYKDFDDNDYNQEFL